MTLRHEAIPAPAVRQSAGRGLVQRCGGINCPPGTCDHTDDPADAVHRSADPAAAPDRAGVPASVLRVLDTPGTPLDAPTRSTMEARLGHGFGHVRVHTDYEAARSARSIQAHAYTSGSHVVMGAGRFQPHTPAGGRLLAHELTHVVQQAGTSGPATSISDPGDHLEQEAEHAAGRTARPHVSQALADRVHRAVDENQLVDLNRQSTDDFSGDGGQPGGGMPPVGGVDAGTTGADAGTMSVDAGSAPCALTTWTGSNFVGETVTADVEFVDSLDAINAHAIATDVNVHVTSSFRTSTVVPGAIVTPAQMSNHLAGHAIDMNVKHGPAKSQWCNSACLGGTLPTTVKPFIDAIRGDAGLRWGGDFTTPDPVHIDDHLNQDPTAWKARRDATQAARVSGCG